MKRIIHVALVLVMVMGLAFSAYAAEGEAPAAGNYTITINSDSPNHIYKAYQVFAADLSEKGDTLSNIRWGSGVKEADKPALGDVSKHLEKLKDSAAAGAFAKEIVSHLEESAAKSSALEGGKHVIKGLQPGYYLVKDTFKDGTAPNGDAYSAYIMQVVGNVNVNPKAGAPVVEKKVEDANDSAQEQNAWQDSADHDMGDHVPFRLTATLGQFVSSYKTYKIVFHDTLSAGLDFDADSVRITLDEKDVTDQFRVTPGENHKVDFACDDIMKLGAKDGSKIVVTYTATLNDQAVIGAGGNPNKVSLEYSNDPNWTGAAESAPTGNTAEDTVKVFTYQLTINKEDEKQQPLVGAGFTLYKKSKTDGQYHAVGAEQGGKDQQVSTFQWKGLDDGEYKLEETTTPDGYNTMEPLFFTITAKHDEMADVPALKELNGEKNITGDVSTGVLTGTVVNVPGMKLPSTGGIGTTVFYAAGGILILLSGGVLLFKKRNTGKA